MGMRILIVEDEEQLVLLLRYNLEAAGYTVEADGPGVRYRTEFRFEDDGAGTRVTMTFGGEPTTTVSRILAVLTKPLTGSVRKAVEADLADMKRYLERPGS